MEQEHQRLETYLDNLLRDLSNLATDALEKVEKNKAKPRPTLSSILAKAANIKVKREDLDRVYQDVPSAINASVPAPVEAPKKAPEAVTVREVLTPAASIEPIQPIQPIQPEVPTPHTPVPDVPSPDIERPRPDIPEIQPNRIERPVPEIQPVQPETPEIQPPNTQPQPSTLAHSTRPVREKAVAGGSFFDEFE